MKVFFSFVIAVMISVSVWASLDSNVVSGFQYLFANRWGIATLGDTYFSFTIIYLWMAYKEPAWSKRVAWLIAVYAFGTIAISVFMLHELMLRKGQGFEAVLLRNPRGTKLEPKTV
jgi:hypothetical protein